MWNAHDLVRRLRWLILTRISLPSLDSIEGGIFALNLLDWEVTQKVSDVSNRPCTCFVKKSPPIAGLSILLARSGFLSDIVCRVFHKVKDRVRWSIGEKPKNSRYLDAAVRLGKGKMCFIKRKDKRYISNNRNFKQKKYRFSSTKKKDRQKQVDFFSNRVLFCIFLLSFQRKVEIPFHARHRRLFLTRVDTLANGHAPAHRALNDFAFLAFTLHLYI